MNYSVAIMALAIPACGLHAAWAHEPGKAEPLAAPSGLAALARARAAGPESAWKDIRSLTARGRIDTSGLSGSWTRAEDLTEGRYVVAADLGVMRIAEGYDGRVHWRQDPSGGVHPLNGAFSQMRARTDAWLARRDWLRADAGGARLGAAETRAHEGREFVVLEATPPRGQPVEMWFDASTFLLERTVRTMPISIQTVRYSDYRRVSWKMSANMTGIALPHTIETSDSSSPSKDIVRVDHWEPRKRMPKAAFAAPTPPADTTLDGETTVPLDIQGLVVVGARLNGRDFDFILDTGGHNIITPEVAKLLGLHPVGEGASGGSGSGTLTEQYVRIERLELGAATLRDQHFYVLPLQYSTVERGERAPLAGLLGLEIFERFAVRIDYPGARLTLRKPDRFRHTTGGVSVPIAFDDDQPFIEGRMNGVSGLFGVDTGNASTLVVQPVWARENGLADALKRGVETVSYGAGGASSNWVSRVHSVEVGGVTLPRQIVRYAEDKSGAFSSRTEAANIGTDTLSNFVLDIDYKRGVIWFEFRQGHVSRPFNRAGMSAIKDDPGGFRVTLVVPDSPAAQAGLEPGDLILAVDGVPAQRLSGRNLADKLIQAVGTEVVLATTRGSVARTAIVSLREMLP